MPPQTSLPQAPASGGRTLSYSPSCYQVSAPCPFLAPKGDLARGRGRGYMQGATLGGERPAVLSLAIPSLARSVNNNLICTANAREGGIVDVYRLYS